MAIQPILSVFTGVLLLVTISSCQDGTFTNPIVDGVSADPFVIYLKDQSSYFMLLSTSSAHEITIYKSPQLTNFRNAESRVIFRAPEGYQSVWASEMHEMQDGNLYIFFAMGRIGQTNRNWVIKLEDPNRNPMGSWSSQPIRLLPHLEQPGVDGTILKHNNRFYYVWSGRDMIEGSIPNDSILIAEMIDPTTTGTSFTVVRQPRLGWERNVNEGPFFIYNKGVSYLVFSASFTFSEYYCLGLMSIDEGKDPMVASNWWYGPEDGPVFQKNEEQSVYATGHASFTVSPDGTETWMTYHASDDRERIEHYRVARAEKITWDPVSGRPVFPRAHGYFSPMPLPSGQTNTITKQSFTNPIISGDSPDPRILLLNGIYYLTLAGDGGTSIKVFPSRQLTNFRNIIPTTIQEPNNCVTDIWSPELKVINGQLYMYFSAKNCNERSHTLYVSKAVEQMNPLGRWEAAKALLLPEVQWAAADGSVMVGEGGRLYLVWESHEDPYGIHIAPMVDPMTVDVGERVALMTPSESWHAGVVNGPAFIRRGSGTFMTFSGGNPGGADYCTGLKYLRDGGNPLNRGEWQDVNGSGPVFCKNVDDGVYGPGHVGFTSSPDERETWIVYHAAEWPDRIFGNRFARIEKLEWTNDDKPIFPKPHGYYSPQPLPSGQAN